MFILSVMFTETSCYLFLHIFVRGSYLFFSFFMQPHGQGEAESVGGRETTLVNVSVNVLSLHSVLV